MLFNQWNWRVKHEYTKPLEYTNYTRIESYLHLPKYFTSKNYHMKYCVCYI